MREENRKELRKRLNNVLPLDLDTDFQLDRWLDSYEDKLEKCEPKFREYLNTRKAYGYDDPEFAKTFVERPDVKRHFSIFAQSEPAIDWINDKDNGVVFVECCVSDPMKTARAVRTGDFLRVFFGYCEVYQKLVIEQEKRTGQRSYVVCIFDMKARVNVWMDYYAEMLKKCIIVNPPKLLSALMKIMSLMLPAKMMNRFHIALSLPDDIEKHISRDAIPLGYGGEREFDTPYLQMGYNEPKEVTKDDYLTDGMIWQKHKITPAYETHNVSVGESFATNLFVKKGQTFLYEYQANRGFEVSCIQDGIDFVMPRYIMSTPLLGEEGEVVIKKDGELRMEIKNLSKMFRMKLKIFTKLI